MTKHGAPSLGAAQVRSHPSGAAPRALVAILCTALGTAALLTPLALRGQGEVVVVSELPQGEGKELLTTVCAGCHALEQVLRTRRTQDQWRLTVQDMMARGAQILPDEVDVLVDYLGTHAGTEAQR